MTEVEYQKYIRDFDKKITFCLSIHCERTAARWARGKEAFIKEHEQQKRIDNESGYINRERR